MSFRRALRDLSRWRLPFEDETRLRDLLKQVTRAPAGDDVLPAALCLKLTSTYHTLRPSGRLGFISVLAQFGVRDADVQRCADNLVHARSREPVPRLQAQLSLREALVPRHEQVAQRIAQQPGGLSFLVTMRADLLSALAGTLVDDSGTAVPEAPAAAAEQPDATRAHLRSLDESLRGLLGVWFGSGLLDLHELRWESTPAALLERVVAYERVHPMPGGLADLRRRLGPQRCAFAFVHPHMPLEPLVFVQVALLPRVASHLHDVLPPADDAAAAAEPQPQPTPTPTPADEAQPSVAIFYSISSPFTGLRGVPLGRLLIKRVAATLAQQHGGLRTYATLSPIPGFRRWLQARLALLDNGTAAAAAAAAASDGRFVSADEHAALASLQAALDVVQMEPAALFAPRDDAAVATRAKGDGDGEDEAAVAAAMLRLCARYLLLEKKRQQALDPVAAFHLRNGATLHALHWDANPTPRGRRESGGIMVNYVYELETIERNHSAYIASGEVAASEGVRALLGTYQN